MRTRTGHRRNPIIYAEGRTLRRITVNSTSNAIIIRQGYHKMRHLPWLRQAPIDPYRRDPSMLRKRPRRKTMTARRTRGQTPSGGQALRHFQLRHHSIHTSKLRSLARLDIVGGMVSIPFIRVYNELAVLSNSTATSIIRSRPAGVCFSRCSG